MKLVTIVEIILNRPNTAVQQGFGLGSSPRTGLFTASDSSVETIRGLVVEFAVQSGVPRDSLANLHQVSPRDYEPKVITFDLPQRGTMYSTSYATCRASAALEIEGRFFELSEITDVSALPVR